MVATRRTSPARERLLTAALARFAADGTLSATLDDIRREADVSVGALYHHFADKRALATALYLDVLAGYQAGVLEELHARPAARAGVEGVVRFHVRWCAAQRERARFLLTERGGIDEEGVARAGAAFLRDAFGWYRGHAHYGTVRDLPFDLVYALWLGPAQEWTRHWTGGRARTVPRAVAAELARGAWLALTTDVEETP